MPLSAPSIIWCRTSLVLGLVLTSTLHTQTPSGGGTTFTSRADLITVPVVVTNKSGVHIEDLSKEDFVLLEDGKEQKIAVFEKIQKPTSPPQRSPDQPNQFTNVRAEDSALRQLTIVVLDMINTPVEDQVYARDELLKFLAEPNNVGQPISLLTLSRTGVRLVQQLTTDTKVLLAALNEINRSHPPVTEEPSSAFLPDGQDRLSKLLRPVGEFQVDSEQAALSFERRWVITLTLQGMQQIAQAFSGLPGRKTLVWASAGFPFSVNETTMALKEASAGLDTPANLLPLYESTWKALNQAQISVYPVDVGGLANLPGPPPVPTKKSLPDPFIHGQWLKAGSTGTFDAFARATAGRAFYNKNGLKGALQQAADDSASCYLLAYYLDRSGKKPGWHKLDVKVKRGGVQVLARTGFFLTRPAAHPEHDSKDEIQVALDSPLDYTAIPMTAKWQEVQAASEPGKKKAIFVLTMPANFADIDETDRNHFSLDFWAMARTPAGNPAGDTEQIMEGHMRPETLERFRSKGTDYRGALLVPPGDYTVRFVVRDRLSGRIGSVAAPLKVAP